MCVGNSAWPGRVAARIGGYFQEWLYLYNAILTALLVQGIATHSNNDRTWHVLLIAATCTVTTAHLFTGAQRCRQALVVCLID